jgi:hypothetical protein
MNTPHHKRPDPRLGRKRSTRAAGTPCSPSPQYHLRHTHIHQARRKDRGGAQATGADRKPRVLYGVVRDWVTLVTVSSCPDSRFGRIYLCARLVRGSAHSAGLVLFNSVCHPLGRRRVLRFILFMRPLPLPLLPVPPPTMYHALMIYRAPVYPLHDFSRYMVGLLRIIASEIVYEVVSRSKSRASLTAGLHTGLRRFGSCVRMWVCHSGRSLVCLCRCGSHIIGFR